MVSDVRTGSKPFAIILASGSARRSVPSRRQRRRRRRANRPGLRATEPGHSTRSLKRIASMKRVSVMCSSSARREKPPTEILALLRDRLKNDPAQELGVAAAEQRRITRLRLEKMLG